MLCTRTMQREGADWGGLTSEAAAPAESGRSSRVYSLAKLGPADSGTPIRTSGPTAGETPLHVGISTSSCGSFHYSCKKRESTFSFTAARRGQQRDRSQRDPSVAVREGNQLYIPRSHRHRSLELQVHADPRGRRQRPSTHCSSLHYMSMTM